MFIARALVFSTLIAEHFRFDPNWYRDGAIVGLVLSYYVVLRSVVGSKPELRQCQTRCWHCGIFFLTDPRNAGRCDLGCPFGCREAHRKQQSTLRSVDYYRQPEGKVKKCALNGRRRKTPALGQAALTDPLPWPPLILDYVRGVVSLIEGRRVLLSEVVAIHCLSTNTFSPPLIQSTTWTRAATMARKA